MDIKNLKNEVSDDMLVTITGGGTDTGITQEFTASCGNCGKVFKEPTQSAANSKRDAHEANCRKNA